MKRLKKEKRILERERKKKGYLIKLNKWERKRKRDFFKKKIKKKY